MLNNIEVAINIASRDFGRETAPKVADTIMKLPQGSSAIDVMRLSQLYTGLARITNLADKKQTEYNKQGWNFLRLKELELRVPENTDEKMIALAGKAKTLIEQFSQAHLFSSFDEFLERWQQKPPATEPQDYLDDFYFYAPYIKFGTVTSLATQNIILDRANEMHKRGKVFLDDDLKESLSFYALRMSDEFIP